MSATQYTDSRHRAWRPLPRLQVQLTRYTHAYPNTTTRYVWQVHVIYDRKRMPQ